MDSVVPAFLHPLAAVIPAVLAAIVAWVASTPVIRAADSPILPERLLRWAGQHRFATLMACLPAVFTGRHVVWVLPLAWFGLQITVHRVRRRIFGDTWSLFGQVWWNVRWFLALWAWWWVMMLSPALLIQSDASPGVVLAVGVGLVLWIYFYNDVIAALLGARTIDAPALLAAFEPVLAKARVPRPRLIHGGPRGGLLINAFALSAFRGDTVLFFDGLLAEMTPEESAAVLAHEVGHLEDFATRRWSVFGLGPLLVVGLVLVTLAVQHWHWPAWASLAWVAAPFGTMLYRVSQSQQRETDSDRRAVDLCGDGEALIRALVTIHDRARLPRRFTPEMTQRATHPSLARRIQAIRSASGVPLAPIEPRAFAGDGVPGAVVFEAERLVFVTLGDAVPDITDLAGLVLHARHAAASSYGELSSLHLDPRREDGATLVASYRHGETRRLRIADRDVVAMQALLDVVDQRIGPPVAAAHERRLLGRVAAMAAFMAAMPLFAWGVIGAALLAFGRPTTPLLAATAAGLCMTAVLQLRHPATPWQVPTLASVALAVAVLAGWQRRRERATETRFSWDAFLIAGLIVTGAAAIVPSALIVALGYPGATRLHVAARAFDVAASGWAALGALCLFLPQRRSRIAAAGAFVLAAAIAGLGSNAFRDHVVPDPLVAAAPPVVMEDLDAAPNGQVTTPGAHWSVTLAPDAQHVLLMPYGDEDDDAGRYTVAGFDGWQRDIAADDVTFVDASTLLLSRWENRTLVLSAEPVRRAEPRWSLRIAETPYGSVDVDVDGRWRLEAEHDIDRRERRPLRYDGRIGDDTFTRTESTADDHAFDDSPEYGVAASGAAILVRRQFAGGANPFGFLMPDLAWRSVLERSGGTAPGVLARSRLTIDCSGPSLRSATATCLAQTGDDTFVWEVAADAGGPRAMATLTGRVVKRTYEDRALLLWHERSLLMLWRGTNRALRIDRERDCPCPHDGSYAAGQVVTLTRAGDRDVVTRYPLTLPDAPGR